MMGELKGKGLGLRQEFLNTLLDYETSPVDFLEIAPENWMKVGGKRQRLFTQCAERYPITLHGLSLSIGGVDPINIDFVKDVKKFMDDFGISIYTEHLSYCSDQQGYLYDLLPLPFTEEAIQYVVKRIKQVQDIIEKPLVLENVSYYAAPNQQVSEIDFLNTIIKESGCELLFDVNNVYVNSINHGYDAKKFIDQIPADKIRYIHIAGHLQEAEDLIIDTHGDEVIPEVWDLLRYTYDKFGSMPTLLERDFNIPTFETLLLETNKIDQLQKDADFRKERLLCNP